jgi:hypothetical protein
VIDESDLHMEKHDLHKTSADNGTFTLGEPRQKMPIFNALQVRTRLKST